MLKVTDTGVTIGLQSQAVTPNKLTQILWVGIAIAVVGLLMAFKMLSVAIGLQHVTVDMDGIFPKLFKIYHRP